MPEFCGEMRPPLAVRRVGLQGAPRRGPATFADLAVVYGPGLAAIPRTLADFRLRATFPNSPQPKIKTRGKPYYSSSTCSSL